MSFRKRRRLCEQVSAVVGISWQRKTMRIVVDIQQYQLPLHGLGASTERHDSSSSSCKGSLK